MNTFADGECQKALTILIGTGEEKISVFPVQASAQGQPCVRACSYCLLLNVNVQILEIKHFFQYATGIAFAPTGAPDLQPGIAVF